MGGLFDNYFLAETVFQTISRNNSIIKFYILELLSSY